MRRKNVYVQIILAVILVIGLASVSHADQTALVLVNSSSPDYLNFQHYIQPYLDHFGVPYATLDIASSPVPSDIGDYALIIIGHRQLDPIRGRGSPSHQSQGAAALRSTAGRTTTRIRF